MKITLAVVKRLNMECKALLKDHMLDEAAEITNMILRAYKKGQVEDDAWDFFNSWDNGIKNYFI